MKRLKNIENTIKLEFSINVNVSFTMENEIVNGVVHPSQCAFKRQFAFHQPDQAYKKSWGHWTDNDLDNNSVNNSYYNPDNDPDNNVDNNLDTNPDIYAIKSFFPQHMLPVAPEKTKPLNIKNLCWNGVVLHTSLMECSG